MKRNLFGILFTAVAFQFAMAQAPNNFSYQAVVRNATGNVVSSAGVGLRISILQGSSTGPAVFVETHSPTTNINGLFSVVIGNGSVSSGSIAAINWATGSYFLRSETDPNGGSNYTLSATTQLLSVPYALYAKTAGNSGTTYTSGSGISISGTNQIVNTSPNIPISLKDGGIVTVTGTYPNFTITGAATGGTTYTAGTGIVITGANGIVNSAPNIPVSLTGLGNIVITGANNNFTLSGSNLIAGSNITISGNVISAASPSSTLFTTLIGINGSVVTGSNNNFTVSSQNLVAGSNVTITGNAISVASPIATPLTTIIGFGGSTVTGSNNNFTVSSQNLVAGSNITISGNAISAASPTSTPLTSIFGINGATVSGNNNSFTINGQNLVAGSNVTISGNAISVAGPIATPLTTIIGFGGSTVTGSNNNFTVNSQNLVAGSNITISGNTINAPSQNPLTSILGNNGLIVIPNGQAFTLDGANFIRTIVGLNGITINQSGSNYSISGGNSSLITINGNNLQPVANLDFNLSIAGGYKIGNLDVIRKYGNNNSLMLGRAGNTIMTGDDNYLIGFQAGSSLFTGSQNILMGTNSAISNNGSSNVMIGNYTGSTNLGSNNVFVGNSSGGANTGNFNIFLGLAAGNTGDPNPQTGDSNIAIGINAGPITTTGQSIAIGRIARTYGDNSVAIGYNAQAIGANVMALGGTGPFALKVGIGTSTPAATLDVIGNGRFTGPVTLAGLAGSAANLGVNANGQIITVAGGAGTPTSILGNNLTVNQNGAAFTLSGVNTSISGNNGLIVIPNGNAFTLDGANFIRTIVGLNGLTINQSGSNYSISGGNPSQWSNTASGIYYNGGNIGIGTGTPSAKLDIGGTATGNIQAIFTRNVIDTDFQFQIRNGAGTNNPEDPMAQIGLYRLGADNASIQFRRNTGATDGIMTFATSGVERVRISEFGRVGLGTPTPQNRLDVNGGMVVGTDAGVNFAPANGLLVSGNVGIGTSTPATTLDVKGNGRFTGSVTLAGLAGSVANLGINANGQIVTVTGGSSQWTTTTLGIYYPSNVKIGIAQEPTSGIELSVVGDGQSAEGEFTTYSSISATHSPIVRLYRSRGVSTVPSAVNSGDQLGIYQIRAHDGNNFFPSVSIVSNAAENWTSSVRGSTFDIRTTKIGSPITASRIFISSDGKVALGNNADPGVHTINGTLMVTSFSGAVAGSVVTVDGNGILGFGELPANNSSQWITTTSGMYTNSFVGFGKAPTALIDAYSPTGTAIKASSNSNLGGNYALSAVNSGTGDVAAFFSASNVGGSTHGIYTEARGAGAGIFAAGQGTGNAAIFRNFTGANTNPVINIINDGTGPALQTNTPIKITDGTQGLGKVLTSDATGLATWQTISASILTVNGSNVQPIGYYAFNLASTTGVYKINGANALRADNRANILVGDAGNAVMSGVSNIYIGSLAGTNTTSGSENIFIGLLTARSFNSGSQNVLVGSEIAQFGTTAQRNAILGYKAGFQLRTGADNVFMGNLAGSDNQGGAQNVFSGSLAGNLNNSGNNNVAVGYVAGQQGITGNNNVAVGAYAGRSNTASNNVFVGFEAGRDNTIGANNVFFGFEAGRGNIGSGQNVFVGIGAGFAHTTGDANVLIGPYTGNASATSSGNVMIGAFVGQINNGSENVFIGTNAGNQSLGSNNIFVGNEAGRVNTGSGNIFQGLYAGNANGTGSNNIVIGPFANVGSNNLTNAIAIGLNATVGGSNMMVLGGIGANAVNVGIGTQNPGAGLDVVNVANGIRINQWLSTGASVGGGAYVGTNIYRNHSDNDWKYTNTHSNIGGAAIQFNGNGGAGTENDILFVATTVPGIVNTNATLTETMRIKPSGSIGIGTNNPSNSPNPSFPAGSKIVHLASTGNPYFIVERTNSGTEGKWGMTVGADGSYNIQDIGVGLGANVFAIEKGATIAQLYLKAGGNVGIGTNTPAVPLDIGTSFGFSTGFSTYFNSNTLNGNPLYQGPNGGGNVSVRASGAFLSTGSANNGGFYVTSDERIKRKVGFSDSNHDLSTLMKLKVIEYKYVDSLNSKNLPVKGVFAQQVEAIYPQAVTKQTNFIPNIYALAEQVAFDQTTQTLKVTMNKSHGLNVGDKVKLISNTSGEKPAMVVSVNGNSFTVNNWTEKSEKIFVYGKEVNDFHIVDYDRIFILGISAIQELNKNLEAEKAKNMQLELQIQKMEAESKGIKAEIEMIKTHLGLEVKGQK